MQFTDEQQKYIDEHYQLLPLDADGVPICMGDSVEGELLDDSTVSGTVCAFHLYDDEPDSVYIKVSVQGGWTIKELRLTSCRHVKPDPLKELLNEHLQEREKIVRKLESNMITLGEAKSEEDACDRLFAERIRELMKVSE